MKGLINWFAVTSINQVSNDNNLSGDVQNIINWVVGALALVAVGVMVAGGIGYMTSAGDPGKVKKAKDTILYGLIGLIVAALAYAIVNFVISGVLK